MRQTTIELVGAHDLTPDADRPRRRTGGVDHLPEQVGRTGGGRWPAYARQAWARSMNASPVL